MKDCKEELTKIKDELKECIKDIENILNKNDVITYKLYLDFFHLVGYLNILSNDFYQRTSKRIENKYFKKQEDEYFKNLEKFYL